VASQGVEESVVEESVVEEKRDPPEEGKVVVVLFPSADDRARSRKERPRGWLRGETRGLNWWWKAKRQATV